MKIAITCKTQGPDAELDPRFGRCGFFLFFDTETGTEEFLKNPYGDSQGGAGIQSAREMVSRKVERILTGQVGPNALKVLEEAGIGITSGLSGKVSALLQPYKEGRSGNAR
ncbi:MAG: NifB/NifX family molybdenum-iron cluster-binding protein [Candidatus Omnitrophota bacterium]